MAIEELLTLTERAAKKIDYFRKEMKSEYPLRISVAGGGCSGFQYGFQFDKKGEEDIELTLHGETIIIDPMSSQYLQGVTIDFIDEMGKSGFKVINPNSKGGCGCGKSFEA